MAGYHLLIVTPDRLFFDGEAEQIVARTTEGDVGVLKGHVPYVAPLDTGALRVLQDGKWRTAALSGGFLKVQPDRVTIVAHTCEWEDEIDLERARRAEQTARERLEQRLSDDEVRLAEQKLKRALNRQRIAE